MDINIFKKNEKNNVKKLMDEEDMDKLFNFLCEKADDNNISDLFNSIDELLPHLKNTNDNFKILPNPTGAFSLKKTNDNLKIAPYNKNNKNHDNILDDFNNSVIHLIRVLNKLIIK
jgi:hypothetical protein